MAAFARPDHHLRDVAVQESRIAANSINQGEQTVARVREEYAHGEPTPVLSVLIWNPEGFESIESPYGLYIAATHALILGVSSVLHKSFIEVKEKGTEAATVTGMALCGCSGALFREKLIDFVADHPFLFVIRQDKSEMVFFIGQVVNPKLE